MGVSQSQFSLTSPQQVWPQLTAECQHRAIHCLAQLAFNVVTAYAESGTQEVSDEPIHTRAETARRSSAAPSADLHSSIDSGIATGFVLM